MNQESTEYMIIKSITSKENRKQLKRLFLGAFLLNVGGFTFMYLLFYIMLWINQLF